MFIDECTCTISFCTNYINIKLTLPFQTEAMCKTIDIKKSFLSHANNTYIRIKGFYTWPRFEKEAKCNSEMGY